jgi:hypothetical protein
MPLRRCPGRSFDVTRLGGSLNQSPIIIPTTFAGNNPAAFHASHRCT